MTGEPDNLIRRRGQPDIIVSGNGTEMASHAALAWCQNRNVSWHAITAGKPMQTALVAAVKGRLRNRCLAERIFDTLAEARKIIDIGGSTTPLSD